LVASRLEVEWDEQEQGWMLALAEIRDDTCRGCGGALSETTLKENEHQYQVGLPHRCHRCTALAQAQDKHDGPHPQALHWGVTKTT